MTETFCCASCCEHPQEKHKSKSSKTLPMYNQSWCQRLICSPIDDGEGILNEITWIHGCYGQLNFWRCYLLLPLTDLHTQIPCTREILKITLLKRSHLRKTQNSKYFIQPYPQRQTRYQCCRNISCEECLLHLSYPNRLPVNFIGSQSSGACLGFAAWRRVLAMQLWCWGPYLCFWGICEQF